MSSGSYADREGPGYFLARIRPNNVRLANYKTREGELQCIGLE
jgi:hypothetical protein